MCVMPSKTCVRMMSDVLQEMSSPCALKYSFREQSYFFITRNRLMFRPEPSGLSLRKAQNKIIQNILKNFPIPSGQRVREKRHGLGYFWHLISKDLLHVHDVWVRWKLAPHRPLAVGVEAEPAGDVLIQLKGLLGRDSFTEKS